MRFIGNQARREHQGDRAGMSLRVAKNFRVHHDHIVAVEPYSGGVGITRDGVRAKLETFLLGTSQTAYSLLRNIEVP